MANFRNSSLLGKTHNVINSNDNVTTKFLWLYDNLKECNTKQHQNCQALTLSYNRNNIFLSYLVTAFTIISSLISAVQLSCALSHSQSQGLVTERAAHQIPFHHSSIPSSSPQDVLQHMYDKRGGLCSQERSKFRRVVSYPAN